MMYLPWPDNELDNLAFYQCESDRKQLQQLFGTNSPVVLVTGSTANRVGRAVAKRFAVRGYKVVFHGNSSIAEGEKLVQAWGQAGIEAMVVSGSIDSESNCQSWVEQIRDRFGRLDVVAHCAAVWEPRRLESTDTELIMQQFSINTLGSLLLAKEAGRLMAEQPTGGALVLTGDWAVARPYRDFAAYFASKGSIPTMTRCLAVELANRSPHIRVNAVLPGPVLLAEDTPESTQQAILNQCLLRRHGTADHVARAMVFLAEHEFLTGVCLPVDGGRTIYSGDVADAIAHPDYLEKR